MEKIISIVSNNEFESLVIIQAVGSGKQASFPLPLAYLPLFEAGPNGGYLTHNVDGKMVISVKVGEESDTVGLYLAKVIVELKCERVALASELEDTAVAELAYTILTRICGAKSYKTTHVYALKCLEISLSNARVFERFEALLCGMSICKDLASGPANIIYPEIFAKECEKLAEYGVKVTVSGVEALRVLGMNALLAVASGSAKEPKVVVMEYSGAPGNEEKIGLVGKGVCFDAGGLFIKNQDIMPQMKFDKSGAAAVVGGILAVARQRLPVNVVGVVGLVENMPDGNAYRPSDVITSMSGKTIEVVDPDAEGRLVLADCLYYTYKHFSPKFMVSFGTLTEETMGALGYEYAGLFCKDDKLAEKLMEAGSMSGDLLWRLPQGAEFAAQLESNVADLRNLGVAGAGENAASAEFLHHFVGDTKFAHLDIAGVAWRNEEVFKQGKGSTAFGVRFIENLCAFNL